MSNIKIFNHEQFGEVRTVYNEKKDEIWFVAKDIANILGLTNTTVALQGLEDFERTKLDLGRQGETNMVNESGMYALVIRSRKPQAKQFRIWVTSEVLPNIRKHGAYMTESTIDKLINNPDLVIGLATKLKEEQEQRKKAEDTIKLQTPKVKYFDKVLDAKGSKTTTQVAKLLGLRSAIQLNNILHELGIQYKQSGQWLLYSQYADKGYTETSTHLYKGVDGYEYASKSTKWTEKGIHFIYEQLEKHGLLEAI